MAAGNVISVDLSVLMTSERTRSVLARPVRKSITIPDGAALSQVSVEVTDVSIHTITDVTCFLYIESVANLNVEVRETGGTWQAFVVKGAFLLMGTLDEVRIASATVDPVEVSIIHS